MKALYLSLLALCCLLLNASALTKGMSIQAVEAEMGAPISRMSLGSKEVLLYQDDQKLEFLDGSLQSINGKQIPSTTAHKAPQASDLSDEQDNSTLLNSDLELPVMRDQQTITESTEGQLQLDDLAASDSKLGDLMKKVSADLENYDTTQQASNRTDATNHLLRVLIGFIIEFVITLLILKVAFQLCGFPCLWHQIGLISIIVAAVGALIAFLLSAGLFNPVRIGVSFILLLVLINLLSDVREWATAITIALTTRLISIGVMWLALAGTMMFFGI